MRDWKGKRVVILGLARQGVSLARHFSARGADVVVSDARPAEALSEAMAELAGRPVRFVLGGHPASLLDGADLLCLSGGVPADLPLVSAARRAGIEISNDSQLFLEACPASVVGITGSAGKTTTTTLVGRMAQAQAARAGRRAWVGGNIGRPLLDDLDAIQPDDFVMMELSSFQLELMTRSPHVAAVLNLTPNHLDRHGTMEAYTAAKARILDFQSEEDVAVLGRDDPGAWSLRERARGRVLAFGRELSAGEQGALVRDGQIKLRVDTREWTVLPAAEIELRGEHNLLNVLAACAIAAGMELPVEAMAEGVRGFKGVPHRLEFVREVRGAAWYNDSIATSPERAVAAMRSFDQPLVVLAGGRDKDLPWEAFAEEVCRRAAHLVLFGEAAPKIAAAVEAAEGRGLLEGMEIVPGLEAAVAVAARAARPGQVVLLAPGGTSFDEFRDFEARGERFRELVGSL